MIAGSVCHAVDRAGISIVHSRLDLEAIALARAVFPGGRTQIAQRDLAFAAVQFGNLSEFRGVTVAGAPGKIIEDAPPRAVDRVGAARLHKAEFVKRLMREKRAARRTAGRSIRPTASKTRANRGSGDRQNQR